MFLRCFLTFAKSQPNVFYKNVPYKKRVLRLLYFWSCKHLGWMTLHTLYYFFRIFMWWIIIWYYSLY